MIRDINTRYRSLRADVKDWGLAADTFKEQYKDFERTLREPFDMTTMLEMAKFCEALPPEIRRLKLRGVKQASVHNGELFRDTVRLRSNNGYVDLSLLNQGRALIRTYVELARNMINYSVEQFNANRTQTNSHKAVCLSRDIGRFHTALNRWSEFGNIHWEEIESHGDYLGQFYDIGKCEESMSSLLSRAEPKGISVWCIEWRVDDIVKMLKMWQQFVERIAAFGEARLELTPEQLDAIDPQ